MGASGSGKTTLLNIIADRISLKNAILSGEVLVNDTSKL
jgi:ABC-type lipoprotein export system ATPase subunit